MRKAHSDRGGSAMAGRFASLGHTLICGPELEFYLYKESYAQAHEQDYQNLTPTIPYTLDYHILATTMDEAVIGQIRRGMHGAGIPVEFSKGEAWHGQHELNVRYADAVTSADRHAIYKNGVKEIAFLNHVAATFNAMLDRLEMSFTQLSQVSADMARYQFSAAVRAPGSRCRAT